MKVLTALATAAVAAFALAGVAHAAPVKVKVESGTVVGQTDGDLAVFRKIPYAAAPVGDLRWAPPKAAVKWSGDRPADADGPSCPQQMTATGAPNGGGSSGAVAEDCLTVNVFAPKNAKNLPVMVWLHGGANTMGSGKIYDFRPMASQGLVIVSVNYRLGALGFFAHPALTAAAGKTEPLANYGLMDQIAALQWVQRNAKAFGGDARNVTVFGESAGAMDIYALLGTQAAKGLFQKAILESNIGWGKSPSLADRETAGVAVAKAAGAPDNATVAQLRALPMEKVLAASRNATVVVDGRLVTEPTFDAFKAGHIIHVPIILGSNSYEASLARAPAGAQADNFTDGQAGAPERWIAKQESVGSPAYLYYFSYVRDAQRGKVVGASHASEIAFAQNTLKAPGQADPTAADQAVASLMSSCWVGFAKTGKPICASGPAWPAYTVAGDQLMEFGVSSGVRTNFRKAQLDVAEATGMAPGSGRQGGAGGRAGPAAAR